MNVDKAVKTVGAETYKEMEAMSSEQLKERIVGACEAMRHVAAELDANEAYQEIKENKKALEAGKNEVNKRQRAVIAVAQALLNGDSDEAK